MNIVQNMVVRGAHQEPSSCGKAMNASTEYVDTAKKTEEPLGVELKLYLWMFIKHKDENLW